MFDVSRRVATASSVVIDGSRDPCDGVAGSRTAQVAVDHLLVRKTHSPILANTIEEGSGTPGTLSPATVLN